MIGKATKLAGGALRTRAGFGVLGAATIGAGLMSSLANSEGPWGSVSESITGSRNTASFALRAGLVNTVAGGRVNEGMEDYYYGEPYSAPSSIGRTTPVPGSAVFGLYNKRR